MDAAEQRAEARRTYVEVSRASAEAFDKAVATISAGALALSITFIHDIAPAPKDTLWIGLSWAAFSGALLTSMFSFLTSEKAHRVGIQQLEDGVKKYVRSGWDKATIVLNACSAALVSAGAGCLAYFAYLNLGGA